jgi:hypothetical protein
MKTITLGILSFFAMTANAKIIIKGALMPTGLHHTYYCQGTTGTCAEISDIKDPKGTHKISFFNSEGVISSTLIAKNLEVSAGSNKTTIVCEIIE